MKRIKFRYKDEYTHGEWRKRECTMGSLEECKSVYGLGTDCDYEIISIEDVE